MGVLQGIRGRIQDVQRIGFAFALRDGAKLVGKKRLVCNIRNMGRFNLRLVESDIEVLRQVFREREYDLSLFPTHRRRIWDEYARILAAGKVPLIIDCGANIGASSLWFAHEYPEARVVAVEPDFETAEICRSNVKGRSVEVRVAAIGSKPGKVVLLGNSNESWSIQTLRDLDGSVPVSTIPEIVGSGEGQELFIVKVDIEGFESDLFAANTAWAHDIAALYIEPHDWMLPDRGTSRCFQSVMATGDFDVLISGENLVYVGRYRSRNALPELDRA